MKSYASLKTRWKCTCHCLWVPLGMLCGPCAFSVETCYANLFARPAMVSDSSYLMLSGTWWAHEFKCCYCNLALASLCSESPPSNEFTPDTQSTRQVRSISEKQKNTLKAWGWTAPEGHTMPLLLTRHAPATSCYTTLQQFSHALPRARDITQMPSLTKNFEPAD